MLDHLSPDPRAIGKYTPLLSWIWGQAINYVDIADLLVAWDTPQ